MTYEVVQDLNVRSAPDPKDPRNLIGVLPKGFRMANLEQVSGPPHTENEVHSDAWYTDGLQQFYWGGGLRQVRLYATTVASATGLLPNPRLGQRLDWRQYVTGIPQSWLDTAGAGVKIALIDSGIDLGHPALAHVPKARCRATLRGVAPDQFADEDDRGHGTHLAGLINARGSLLSGIARDAELHIYRAARSSMDVRSFDVAEALRQAVVQGAKVVNMSFMVAHDDPALQAAIAEAVAKDVIMVAAAGEEDSIFRFGLDYPARVSEVIGVAATSQAELDSIRGGTTSGGCDFSLPFRPMTSSVPRRLGDYNEIKGSSQATAIVSATVALLIAWMQQKEPGTPLTLPNIRQRLHAGLTTVNHATVFSTNHFPIVSIQS